MSEDKPPPHPILGLLAASLQEQTTASYSRSDVLRALVYPMAASVGLLPMLALAKAPDWALMAAASVFGTTVLIYLSLYIWCFFTNPDALRSERYQLAKYALEQRLYGDSTTGLLERDAAQALPDGSGEPLAPGEAQ